MADAASIAAHNATTSADGSTHGPAEAEVLAAPQVRPSPALTRTPGARQPPSGTVVRTGSAALKSTDV